MNKAEFIDFLLTANKSGYADENAVVTDGVDGGHEITYSLGRYSFVDYWYGGNPFSGQESIAVDGKAVWAMQYRGGVPADAPVSHEEAFSFLKKALSQCSPEEPLRGPVTFIEGEWHYTNTWNHDLTEFTGHEEILYKGQVAHVTDYMGGLVDGATWEKT